MNGYLMAMRRYAVFSERSARPEYWYFTLFYIIGYVVCYAVDYALFGGKVQVFASIYALAHLVPSIAVAVRRLHDTDRSGWWFLIVFTGIGGFVLLWWYCTRGTPGPNRFGYPTTDVLVTSRA